VGAILVWQFQTKSKNTNIWSEIGFYRINNQVSYLINGESFKINYQKEDNHINFSLKDETPTVISNALIKENNIEFSLNNKEVHFNWVITPNNELLLERGIKSWKVIPHHHLPKNNAAKLTRPSNQNGSGVSAPIPGKIIEINIKEGELIKAGDTLMVLEAMKMENSIQMPQDGIVKKILIEQGKQVKANELLIEIESIKNNI
jgi:acetyl/propionyl-CoA carboxylase alpha subunit